VPRVSLRQIIEDPKDFWGGGSRIGGAIARAFGTASKAELWKPYGVCVTPSGAVVVTDNSRGAVFLIDRGRRKWKRIDKAGEVALGEPVSVAPGPDGGFFVADPALGAVLRFGPSGDYTGSIQVEGLGRPTGVAFDRDVGRLVVADTGTHRIWLLDPDGSVHFSFGGRGTEPGKFNYPTHVAVSPQGEILVTDALNHRVQIFDREGTLVGAFGEAGDGLGAFNRPKGVAADSEGHIYVVDALLCAVQVFDRDGTLLLAVGEPGDEEGQFSLPSGIYIGEGDEILVADTFNGRLQLLQYHRGGR
jgi:DNA-binding beta-propeller fold protein YncE